MRFTNIVSAAALAVALGFSGVAYAQTVVGGVSVTDIDLPRVQAMCDQMVGDTATLGEQTDDTTKADATATAPAGTAAGTGAAASTTTGTDETKGIDDITLRDCVEAGLLPADTVIPDEEAATTN